MIKLRYLNKSFLIFTQENCHFSMKIDRNAFIKVNLSEVYKGLSAMPMLSHPYYTNWTKLTIIYQICKGQDIEVEKIDKVNYLWKNFLVLDHYFHQLRHSKYTHLIFMSKFNNLVMIDQFQYKRDN